MKREEKELVVKWLDKFKHDCLSIELLSCPSITQYQFTDSFIEQFKADNDLIVKEPNPIIDSHIKALTDLGYVVTVEKR